MDLGTALSTSSNLTILVRYLHVASMSSGQCELAKVPKSGETSSMFSEAFR